MKGLTVKTTRALGASSLSFSLVVLSMSAVHAVEPHGRNSIPITAPTDNRSHQDWSQGLGLGNAGSAGDPISEGNHRGKHSDNSAASSAADSDLRVAIATANSSYKSALTLANLSFRDATSGAWTTYQTAKRAATGPSRRLTRVIARSTYDASVSEQEVIRDNAIDAAYATWASDVDLALANYDAATISGDGVVVSARTALRASVRVAGTVLSTDLTTSKKVYRNSKNQAYVALMNVVNANHGPSDAALVSAWDTYGLALEAAQKTAKSSRSAAFTVYKASTKEARKTYSTATGLRPSAIPYTAGSQEKALKIKRN